MHGLIHIYLLSIRRHSLFEATLASRIINFLGIGYLFITFVFIGFFLNAIFLQIESDVAPIDTFSRYFLFIFVADVLSKFFIKSYKSIDVFPYLTLPIPRKKIYVLLFIKELSSGWNFIWVVFLTPFFMTVYLKSWANALLLIFSVYLICVAISLIIRYMDVLSTWKNFLYTFVPLLLAIFIGCIAYYIAIAPNLLINLNLIFSQYKLWVFIGLSILFLCMFLIFMKSCKRELYVQLTGKQKSTFSLSFSWLNNFGVNGEIMKLCLKESMRSQLKRNILISFFFLIYALFCMLYSKQEHYFLQTILAIGPIMLFGFTLGGFSFVAESTFFDKLMSLPRNIPYLILQTKYIISLLFAAFCTLIYSLVFINKISFLYWISIFFYSTIFLFFSFQAVVYNKQRIDIFAIPKLPNSTIHSFWGAVSVFFLQGMIYLLKEFTSEIIANWIMLITGVLVTGASLFWIKKIYKRFLIRKYQNMDGFRNIS